ncbi:MAG: DMT family transporter [Gammaproteobacteria bacterium]
MLHLKLIAASGFWALTPIIARVLADYSAPYALVFGRFLVAAVALFFIMRATGTRIGSMKRFAVTFALLGLTGICLHNVLVFMGVEHTQANRANVIFATIPIIVAVIDGLFLGNRYHRGAMFGIATGILGTAIVMTDGALPNLFDGAIGIGEWLVLGSAASWALYSIIGRAVLREVSPLVVTYLAVLFGLVLLVPFVSLDSEAIPRLIRDPAALGMIAFLGVFNSALGFLWYSEAVAGLGAMATSAYINLVPVFGVVLSALLLSEMPSVSLLTGAGLVIGALILINRYPSPIASRESASRVRPVQ